MKGDICATLRDVHEVMGNDVREVASSNIRNVPEEGVAVARCCHGRGDASSSARWWKGMQWRGAAMAEGTRKGHNGMTQRRGTAMAEGMLLLLFVMAKGDVTARCCHGGGNAEGTQWHDAAARCCHGRGDTSSSSSSSSSSSLPWRKGMQRRDIAIAERTRKGTQWRVEKEEMANTKNVQGAVACHGGLLFQLPWRKEMLRRVEEEEAANTKKKKVAENVAGALCHHLSSFPTVTSAFFIHL
ncbi:hypothetical protein AHAS_Ahas13G0307300 [Arachis hypogaea]